jgi:hypothetical protein
LKQTQLVLCWRKAEKDFFFFLGGFLFFFFFLEVWIDLQSIYGDLSAVVFGESWVSDVRGAGLDHGKWLWQFWWVSRCAAERVEEAVLANLVGDGAEVEV